jgi:thiol peroxidase
MSRSGAVTFKGNPLTLAGDAVKAGQKAPSFKLHRFADGKMQEVTLDTVRGKPTIISVVPSLDTPVCQIQTKKFNESLGAMGDKINALTVSLDLPFAMNRFCGAEKITSLISASDYQDRNFGQNWGMLIEELKILARGVFVLDADGKVVYAEQVKEVAEEPNYDAAMSALKSLVK